MMEERQRVKETVCSPPDIKFRIEHRASDGRWQFEVYTTGRVSLFASSTTFPTDQTENI